ncbi:MAG: hypothetical protein MJ227_00015 [Bacilli bacterium]|nr:hypothetical protein [Bacilli bacterium]
MKTNIKKALNWLVLAQALTIVSSIVSCFLAFGSGFNPNLGLNPRILLAAAITSIVAVLCEVIGYWIAKKEGSGFFKTAFGAGFIYLIMQVLLVIFVFTGVFQFVYQVNAFYFVLTFLGIFIVCDALLGIVAAVPNVASFFMASFWALIIIFFFSIFFRWMFPVIVTTTPTGVVVTNTWVNVSNAIFAVAQGWYLVLLVKAKIEAD